MPSIDRSVKKTFEELRCLTILSLQNYTNSLKAQISNTIKMLEISIVARRQKLLVKKTRMLNKHVRCSSLKNFCGLKKWKKKRHSNAEACPPDRKYDILFWAWDQTESIICVPNRTSQATVKLNCWKRFMLGIIKNRRVPNNNKISLWT